MAKKANSLKDYLSLIKERVKKSRITKPYQMAGLVLAEILEDESHKSLYIKLAKEYNGDFLISLAKDIADRPRVKNKGAYFMKVFYNTLAQEPQSVVKSAQKPNSAAKKKPQRKAKPQSAKTAKTKKPKTKRRKTK